MKISQRSLIKLICMQSILAMSGSLYYSNFGDPVVDIMQGTLFSGDGLQPCTLCRWARILMYPIVWLSGMALLRRKDDIITYLKPIALVGIVLETYHYLLQKTNRLDFLNFQAFCTKANPCAASQQVNYLWFITIPLLCLIAFSVIYILIVIYQRRAKKTLSV